MKKNQECCIIDNLLIEEYKKRNGIIFENEKVIDINFQEKIVGCPYEKGRNCLEEFNQYLLSCGFDNRAPARMKGATLPYGHNDGKATVPEANILLVGDAAGMADCLTGEGIYFALKSGILAATAIAGKEKVLETYQASCQSIFELVNKSYKVGRIFYRYKRFFMLFAKNQEKRLVHFCDNEIAYYNYGYDYNMRKKIFSFLWRR